MTFKIAENCIGCGTCQQACRVGSIPPGGPVAPRPARPEDKPIQKDGKMTDGRVSTTVPGSRSIQRLSNGMRGGIPSLLHGRYNDIPHWHWFTGIEYGILNSILTRRKYP